MAFLIFDFELGSKLGYFWKILEKLGSFWATFNINLGSLFRSDLATLLTTTDQVDPICTIFHCQIPL